MESRIELATEKKLIGKRITMSFSNNKTGELWKSFMQNRKEITNNIGTDLYSMQIYAPLFFQNFDPNAEFEKLALTEVSDFDHIPDGMETFTLNSGLYAVFLYKGDASNAAETFQYILGTWLPASDYMLDTRPHFEILGDKYKKGDPNSEEEIWIPVRLKV
jgi:AraC family transcriptional regulator